MKKYSEVHDDGNYTALCWLEIVTLKEHKNGSSDINKEYAIVLQSPGDIPPEYLEKDESKPVVQYELTDKDTKRSQVVNFTVIDVQKDITVYENRKVLCASGPLYTKEFIEWPTSNRKRIEIKVSPKRKTTFARKTRTSSTGDSPTNNKRTYTSTEPKQRDATEKDAKVANSNKVNSVNNAGGKAKGTAAFKNGESNNNDSEPKKKKKKLVTESESTKRISLYRSTVHNEPEDDSGFEQRPITRKYVVETTVTNKPGETNVASNNSRKSEELEPQSSLTNAITTLPPHSPKPNDKLNINSFCAAGNQHVLMLKVKVEMEHKVIPVEGDSLLFPVIEMEKKVEFGLNPNAVNKSETVTALSMNEQWEEFLNDLNTDHNDDESEKHSTVSARYRHSGFSGSEFTNTVNLDEATKYVSQLKNSLGGCEKYPVHHQNPPDNNVDRSNEQPSAKKDSEKQETSVSPTVDSDVPKNVHTDSSTEEDDDGASSEAFTENTYLNQPTARDLVSNRRKSKEPTEPERRNKNRAVVVTDVKKNHASEEYVTEEKIDQQPSVVNSRRIPAKPVKQVSTYKRVIFYGDDPDDDVSSEVIDDEDDPEEEVVDESSRPTAEALKSVPETVALEQATPIANTKRAGENGGNFLVKFLGTLNAIFQRLGT